MVVAAAPRPVLLEGLPEGLVAQILEGKVLRTDRIEACRLLLLEGRVPDAHAVADAMVREVAGGTLPASY
jgi:hypothetical protein